MRIQIDICLGRDVYIYVYKYTSLSFSLSSLSVYRSTQYYLSEAALHGHVGQQYIAGFGCIRGATGG